jgi:hypothetical protein
MVLASTEPFQPSAKLVSKAEEIHRVLNASTVDVWKLREFALSEGGLVDGRDFHFRIHVRRVNPNWAV